MRTHYKTLPWGAAVFVCGLVLVLAVLPPFVGHGFRHALMQGFDLTCHQIPERSFQIGGIPFALCHRCTGVVVGLVVGTALFPLVRRWDNLFERHAKVIMALSVLPMVVDWGVDALGLWANLPVSRVVTGLVFGLVAGYAFARALALPSTTSVQKPLSASTVPVLSHSSPTTHHAQ